MSKKKLKIFLILNLSFFLMPLFALAMDQNLIDDPFRGKISTIKGPSRDKVLSIDDPNHPCHDPFLRDDRSAASHRAGAGISGPEARYSPFDSLQASALTAPHNTAATAAPHALPAIREAVVVRMSPPQPQPQQQPHSELQYQSTSLSHSLNRPPTEDIPPKSVVETASSSSPPTAAAPLLSPVPPIDSSRVPQSPTAGSSVRSEEVETRIFLCSCPPLPYMLSYSCTYILVTRYCDPCCDACFNGDYTRECAVKYRDCCNWCGDHSCMCRCACGRRCTYGCATDWDYYCVNGCCRRPQLALPQANRQSGASSENGVLMTRG